MWADEHGLNDSFSMKQYIFIQGWRFKNAKPRNVVRNKSHQILELLKEYKGWIIFIVILYLGVFAISKLPSKKSYDYILQKFSGQEYSAKIGKFKESGAQTLILEKSDKVLEIPLEQLPVQINGISNDSVFIVYFIFYKMFRDTVEYVNVDNKIKLVVEKKTVISSGRRVQYDYDSVVNNNQHLFFYTEGILMDSISQASLQFDSESFFIREYDSAGRSLNFKYYRINDKDFFQSYKN
jgi:hypothetical protein